MIPSQLPPVPANFTGRNSELAELDGMLDEPEGAAVRLVVISGAGGVGKTALGLRWLHRTAARFGGARLFADLGAHGVAAPVSPGEVLGRFLRAFGIPAEQVPVELSEQVALYRSVTAQGNTLVFLDDALTAGQVRPLIPAAGGLVLATSRSGLGGLSLDGARRLWLRPLDVDTTVQLLARLVGADRAVAEPDAVRAVARLCGGFPIAIRVAAAQIALRPRWNLERLARELGSGRPLTVLVVEEDRPVQAAFDLSYQALAPPAARLYRLLGLHPGSNFGPGIAGAAVGVAAEEVEEQIDELLTASLLVQAEDGGFRFHDLLRLHALSCADSDETPAGRRAALRRMLDWYLHVASAADQTLTPYRERLPRDYRYVPADPASFANRDLALAWLEEQRANLVAAIHTAGELGFPTVAWQLADAMWPLLLLRKHYRDWVDIDPIAIAGARASGHRAAEARLVNRLGHAYSELGRFAEAADQFTAALLLRRETGDRHGEAGSLRGLGITLIRQRRCAEAVARLTEALGVYRELGAGRGAALTLIDIGEALILLGRDSDAVSRLDEADRLLAAEDDQYNRARVGMFAGQALAQLGDLPGAEERLGAALAVMRRFGSRSGEGDTLAALGDLAERRGAHGDARRLYGEALAILDELGTQAADEIRTRLNRLADQDHPKTST